MIIDLEVVFHQLNSLTEQYYVMSAYFNRIRVSRLDLFGLFMQEPRTTVHVQFICLRLHYWNTYFDIYSDDFNNPIVISSISN